MDANQLRRSFLSFFEERNHTVRPSASLIPIDPTLMLNPAGMVPFKPYFLGEEKAPFDRAVSIQKCVRTVDIDIIGTTTRHFSFFEMLGNFSFGEYFKEDAIPWAYEFVTEVMGLDPELLWYTVHETDDEAERIWIEQVGIPPERVQRGGQDNFWQMGVPGPCGPCSEIFFDRGPKWGEPGGPIGGGEERYVEVWNLVFMQNIQDEPYTVIGELPAKSIDTGMGLERALMVIQRAETVFDVDTVRPILDVGAEVCGVGYGLDEATDISLRVLADHGRAVTFLIGDGVVPSNEGRGYILRRLLRRAVRHAWQLGGHDLVTPRLVETTIGIMAEAYPQLQEKRDLILDVVTREETRFRRTLESGHTLLDAELNGLAANVALPGEVAFKLHDTYGFPIELTKEIVAERGFGVDESGFELAMEKQRERARAAWKGTHEAAAEEFYRRVLDETGLTQFVGYDLEKSASRVLAIVREGESVERADVGQDVEIFLDATPFYAEAGGQVGDVGSIDSDSGRFVITDTQHAVQGLYAHRGKVAAGHIRVGQDVVSAIDSPRRDLIRKSHTGTHILHWALRQTLGDHVHQAGSYVQANRLRFDFSHFSGLDDDEFYEIERVANDRIVENAAVTTVETSKDEAVEMGALAFFGDKYGEKVRVVRVGEFSTEFCGGTHTNAAGSVGPVIVLSESSIGSNLRRVEALTGSASYAYLAKVRRTLDEASHLLRTPIDDIPDRIKQLAERSKELEGEIARLDDRMRAEEAAELVGNAMTISEHRVVVAERPPTAPDALRALAIQIRDRLDSGFVMLGANNGGKGALVAAATADLVSAGVSAGEILAEAARQLGGGGSRDPELAQAGGPKGDKVAQALDVAREAIGRSVGGP